MAIGDGVTSIGTYAFNGCAAVTDFSVAGDNPCFRSVDGVLYDSACAVLYAYPGGKELHFFTTPVSVKTIEANAFSAANQLIGVTLPCATEIRGSAFSSSVRNVFCPKLQTLGNGAFGSSDLVEFTFGPQTESIGPAAFMNCTLLQKLTFMGSPPSAGRFAFQGVSADAYYPGEDPSWTEEVRRNYGTGLNWIEYTGLPDGYYLIGPDGWTEDGVDLNNCFVLNCAQGNTDPSVDEFMLAATLTAGDPVKVVKVFEGTITEWYPDGTGNEYVVDAAHSGDVTIYFRPRYNGDWSAFGGYIWIEAAPETKYGLRVDGTEVTSANMSDILGNGIFSFDGESTLTVSGDYSSPASNDQLLPVIENYGLDGLTVDLQGKLTGYLTLDRDTTLCGTGSLVLPADRGAEFGIRCRSLTIIDVALDLHVSGTALWGWFNDSALVLDNVTATLESGSANGRPIPAVSVFPGGITLKRCSVVEPVGAKVDEECSGEIRSADGDPVSLVKIGRWENPFVDVEEGRYYYEPILWAFYHDPQVTNGTDDTHFSPNKTCTRGQVVTFLYNAFAE